MASTPTTATNPYTFQRPSTTATRSLIGDRSAGHPASSKPLPHSHKSNNYERAAADAAKNGTVGGTSTVSGTDGPGKLDRQHSWDMRDMKRVHHENLLAGQSSTTTAAAGGPSGYTTAGARQ